MSTAAAAADPADGDLTVSSRTERPLGRQPAPDLDLVDEGEQPRIWRERGFTRYLTGFGLSLLGDQIWFVALAWAAVKLDTATHTSLVMAAGSVPRAVLILLGGALADLWGALRIMLASQALRTLVMLIAAGAVLAVNPEFWLLTTVAIVFGALDAVHMPAAGALPPQLLTQQSLPAGQGVVQTLERVATIIGAPIGGLIVAVGGLGLATGINAALFSAALFILRALRLRSTGEPQPAATPAAPGRTEGAWRLLRAGLVHVVRDAVLGPVLLIVTVLNMAIAAPLNVGVALLANAQGWGASGFSAIIAGFGVGATVGALSLVRYHPKRRPAAVGLIWVAAGSLCIAALGGSPNLPTAMTAACLLGLTSGPASALLLGLVQARTPTTYLGRVMALIAFSALGLVPVSYTLFGLLTNVTSITAAFAICAIVELAVVLVALGIRTVRTAKFEHASATHEWT